MRLLFATLPHDVENSFLQIGHDGVCPEVSIPVEVGGEPLPAGEMQTGLAARQRLQTILTPQNVKVCAADPDML